MAYKAITLALGIILVAAPAAAAEQAAQKTPAQADKTKYCVEVEASTGSLLKTTQCKTRAEWAKEGVDVDQLKKN